MENFKDIVQSSLKEDVLGNLITNWTNVQYHRLIIEDRKAITDREVRYVSV